ncbi:unnamed protein product [Clonostachys rhizophaga]|uniref:Nephrocystin 3-like N-terminal domain-containing protein n=1 Tax=Clonostachys rhizophaga TaxID=160324 RepID=A0A9N9YM20_9HYPO|nr:unnamed protein product [Clonostachys rhizophaga]
MSDSPGSRDKIRKLVTRKKEQGRGSKKDAPSHAVRALASSSRLGAFMGPNLLSRTSPSPGISEAGHASLSQPRQTPHGTTTSTSETCGQFPVAKNTSHQNSHTAPAVSSECSTHDDGSTSPKTGREQAPDEQEEAMRELWQAAIGEIKDSPSKDDQKLAEVVESLIVDGEDAREPMTINDLAGFISRLEQEMRHEGIKGKISDIFQRAIPILNKFAIVGDVAVSCNPNPAALPWAAVRSILLNLTAGTEIRIKVVEGIAKITALFFQCTQYQGIYMTSDPSLAPQAPARNAINHLRTAIVEALAQSIRFLSYALHRQRQKSRAVTAAFSLSDVVSYLGDLDTAGKRLFEAGDNCEKHCNVQNRATVQDMHRLIVEMGQALKDASAQETFPKELEKLLVAQGAAFDDIDNQDDATFCYDGTRTTLLQDVYKWIHDSQAPSTFWLSGLAGTGKSTISRTIARQLQRKGLGATFFFKKGRDGRSEGKRVFGTIAYQLALNFPSLRPHICGAIKAEPTSVNAFMDIQFQRLILDPLDKLRDQERPEALVIVIDALDECDNENHRETMIRLLTKSKAKFFKVFITSRPEYDIKTHFTMVHGEYQDLVLHRVARKIVEQDIRVVLRSDLDGFRAFWNKTSHKSSVLPDGWPGLERREALVQMCTPLFISAATILRVLKSRYPLGKSPEWKIDSMLKSKFSTMGDPYAQLYGPVLKAMLGDVAGEGVGMCSEDLDDFKAIVGAIILLADPLSIDSLAGLLGKGPMDIKSQLDPLHSVLDIPDGDRPVRLFHLSFRDYLLGGSAGQFQVVEADVHGVLGARCLELMSTYLKEDICELKWPGESCPDKDTINAHLSPEVQYTCRYWVYHTTESGKRLRDGDKACTFFQQHFLHWLEALTLMDKVAESTEMINNLQSVIHDTEGKEFSRLLHDAGRFILYFRVGFVETPLQLYVSGPVFTPTESTIPHGRRYPEWITRRPVTDLKWTPCLQTLEGTAADVRPIFLADGRLVSVSSHFKRQSVQIWDPASGSCLRTLPENGITALACWGNTRLVSGSPSGEIKTWDLRDGTCLQTFRYGDSVRIKDLAFSDDGKHFCVTLQNMDRVIVVDICDSEKCQVIRRLDISISDLFTFSGYGQFIATRSEKKDRCRLSRWAVTGDVEWRELQNAGTNWLKTLAFSADGILLAGMKEDSITVWNTETRECVHTLPIPSGFHFMRPIAVATNWLAVSTDSRPAGIYKLNTAPGECQFFSFDNRGFQSQAISVDGKLLAGTSSHEFNPIQLLDTAALALNAGPKLNRRDISSVAFVSASNLVLSIITEGDVEVRDALSGVCQGLLQAGGDIHEVAVAERAPVIALIEYDYSGKCVSRIWNLDSMSCMQTFEWENRSHRMTVQGLLTISRNGETIAAWTPSSILLWHLTSTSSRHQEIPVVATKGEIVSSCISPGGDRIAVAVENDMEQKLHVEILISSTGKPSVILTSCSFLKQAGERRILFSPSGDRVAFINESQARIWSVPTGQCLWKTGSAPWNLDIRPSFLNLELECPLGQGLPVPQQLEACLDYWISDEGWVLKGGRKLMWLPPDYRPANNFGHLAVRILGSTIVIGTNSGRVDMIRFELED